ncbi:MAG: hypothetical protein KJ621_02485 [Proteobacteria bacterium]|nr:hypothetical protein [Pseudomonadota bacterium]
MRDCINNLPFSQDEIKNMKEWRFTQLRLRWLVYAVVLGILIATCLILNSYGSIKVKKVILAIIQGVLFPAIACLVFLKKSPKLFNSPDEVQHEFQLRSLPNPAMASKIRDCLKVPDWQKLLALLGAIALGLVTILKEFI